jgi:NAD(P)-dependent dehydrogenase (short-subunit alcohol dehydrogenase family)
VQKTVFITGVLGGIGKSIANKFRNEGYYVIGADRILNNLNYLDLYILLDLNQYVIDANYRERKNSELSKEVQQIDVLINNAAVQKLGDLESITLEDWVETLNVNLTAPMLLSQHFLKLLSQNVGSIINIASIHHILTKPNFVTYATSKSALVGLTKSMAVDLKGKVRVNAISPAAIETDMLLDGFDNNPNIINKLNKIHPIQRIGQPDEVAQMAFLLSDKNLGFINGANINMDGGISSVLSDL